MISWNAGAERIKGWTASEISGQSFERFYPPADVAAGKTAHELKVAAETGALEDYGWRVRKDGTRFWANVVITALRDETVKRRFTVYPYRHGRAVPASDSVAPPAQPLEIRTLRRPWRLVRNE